DADAGGDLLALRPAAGRADHLPGVVTGAAEPRRPPDRLRLPGLPEHRPVTRFTPPGPVRGCSHRALPVNRARRSRLRACAGSRRPAPRDEPGGVAVRLRVTGPGP